MLESPGRGISHAMKLPLVTPKRIETASKRVVAELERATVQVGNKQVIDPAAIKGPQREALKTLTDFATSFKHHGSNAVGMARFINNTVTYGGTPVGLEQRAPSPGEMRDAMKLLADRAKAQFAEVDMALGAGADDAASSIEQRARADFEKDLGKVGEALLDLVDR